MISVTIEYCDSSASNRIIGAKDHASVQINIAEVDKVTGRFNGQFKTYAICGAIRRMGESDDSILRLAKNDGVVAKDHASVQINIAEVDKVTGRFNGQFKTYAICGAIRRMGESDDSILRLAKNDGVVAKDHASVQINIAEVDKVTGHFNGQFKTYAICGAIRRMGESDDSILRLAKNDGVVAKDHASVQINIAEVDNVTGRFNGQFKTYAICGAIRRMGESDDSILRLAKNDGVVAKNI
nr:uncharacterized protein LOC125992668 [Syngnathus scovelli]